ncbi:hypothetical protein C7271_19375 [filamentous cyanobacterium CCP5]|nr:hypothetical protein C7271_19375 [filamentous cyanobacterium CCP5]
MPPPGNIDRQREHQANERTFLAWLRTSIALVGFGFAIARFGIFLQQIGFVMDQPAEPIHPLLNSQVLGICLVVLGIAVIGFAGWRYNVTFWQIERGAYRPSRLMVWTMTVIVMVLGLLSIPILLVRSFDPSPERPPEGGSNHNLP